MLSAKKTFFKKKKLFISKLKQKNVIVKNKTSNTGFNIKVIYEQWLLFLKLSFVSAADTYILNVLVVYIMWEKSVIFCTSFQMIYHF